MLFCLLVLEGWNGEVLPLLSFSLCCRFNRTVSYIFTSVRSAGGTFVDWYKSTQKIALSTPHLETEFPFCGGKRKISASDASTTVSSANLTFQKHQSAIILKPHSVIDFSQRKLKRTASLSFSPRISCGGFICSALIFSFVVGFRETSV